ncbi:O-acyltransferase like protein-like [Galleria mellonella]|uniref:O-acyltransferase like protein-like n=1 Tax=Galleria mellonella TaxID=7137 RepID=A0ABM3MXP1_GALME|nr:O-acyltransferase like protein-like [Galleria mellonella]
MEFKLVFIIIPVFIITANGYRDLIYNRSELFDDNLYEEVLNRRQCAAQVKYLRINDQRLWGRFLDARSRFPRSLTRGNVVDLGGYDECLGIEKNVRNMSIEGKFCMVRIPLIQFIHLVNLSAPLEFSQISQTEVNRNLLNFENTNYNDLTSLIRIQTQLQKFVGMTQEDVMQRTEEVNPVFDASIRFAVCIPKPCSLRNALNIIFGLQITGLQVEEGYCRLPNDKPWVAADYIAVSIFSVIGFLMVLSTTYDIRHRILLKRDPKTINKLLLSFSVYTNTLRLVTYKPSPGALECLDGIRAFAMMWVIVGHTHVTYLISAPLQNPLQMINFMQSFWSLWITSSTITVDTFFTLSGLLLIYTTTGKITGWKLMKNLHLFYLNRYLRLFPVLAACVLLQASLFHRVSDGPAWEAVAQQALQCRKSWWPTLLFIQNFYSPLYMCLSHTWYLAIDFQLFLISPLILFWVVSGKKRTAWITLITALLASLIGSTIYNFIMGFKAGPFTLSLSAEDQPDYFSYYYVNPLVRSSPFFVGMIFGYILHLCRGKEIIIPKAQVALLWLLALILSSGVIYMHYPVIQIDWDKQTVNDLVNSFMRPIWSLCVSWMIFACVHGYAGPINWLLSHPMWKILGRLSYAMYIFHYPLMILVNGTVRTPLYFSNEFAIQKFLADFVTAVLVAYIVTMFVDAPCSVLIKHFLGVDKKQAQVKPLSGTDNPKEEKN